MDAMSTAPPAATVFASVARKVRAWVVLRRWLALLRMTFIHASLVLALIILAALRGRDVFLPAWGGLSAWLAGCLAYAWWRRPGAFSALALWDQAAGRREAFATAWWFEQCHEGGDAARAHIDAQREVLPRSLLALHKDLPLRPDRWLALPLFIAILGSFISIVTAPSPMVVAMDAAMTRRAAEEAKKLTQAGAEKKKLAGLNDDENKQVEDLRQKMQQAAAELAQSAGKDARDVLAELERRARDAEKLADEFDKGREAWASEKLIETLREHTDTADLGDAVAAKNAKTAAKAAETLASQLKSPQITGEAKERMNETLKEVQQQSEKEDRQRTVGQNVLAAGDRMREGQPAGAGEEFQKLADKLRGLALREQARDGLRQLAQQLRDSGSSIAGQNENNGAMQQMGQTGQGAQSGQQGSVPQVGQAQNPRQQLMPPGMGQQQNQMQQQPQQGTQGQQQQMLTMGQQGPQGQQGQPSSGQPMLLAPVPGEKADDKAPMVIMPGDDSPGETSGPVIVVPASGLPPGAGKAELNNTPTQKQETGTQGVVQAQQNSEGQSTVRSVEGGARAEKAARSATQTALEAIQAEEAALDESALPPARREQVRRYFNELRKRFEGK